MDQKQYITKDSVRDMIMGWSGGFDYIEEPVEGALEDLRGIPTVDAVPVVRCKECKWYQLDPWGSKVQCEKIYDVADGDLDAFYFRPSPEHFCSYGERKGGVNDGT